MKEELIYELKSLYRDNMRIRAFRFGEGEDSACVVGATRGNDIQPLYVCSRLVRALRIEESEGRLAPGRSILVIPTVNSYSMNMDKRFWPTDNTDINRMFPGYSLGETTQRIAAGVFDRVSRFQYGIQLASYYMPGYFIPHVRMMKTGYESPELARLFGLPYALVRWPKPYDTATLNYNWQLWNTRAFSIYTSTADQVDEASADVGVEAMLGFLRSVGVLLGAPAPRPDTRLVGYEALLSVRAGKAGLFRRMAELGQDVRRGDTLALIQDPYTGEELERVCAPADSRVFFAHSRPLTYACSVLFRLIPLELL